MLTVSQLNQLIKGSVNSCFPQLVWLVGEIQGYNRNRNKSHVFFELVEKDKKSHDIKSKIGLVIFAGKKAMLADILRRSENAFALKDDIEVKFACRVDYYPPHGAMRLIVESIDPVHTLGKVAQQRQKLIAELQAKGTLEKNKLCELPQVSLRIGLITSHDSAAYNDFINELEYSGIAFKVLVRNALMQGTKTESDVSQAIKEFQKRKDIDVIVVTRGGGSIADLSWFDSKKIAEAIAESRCPVLSGIGHEINSTVTDLAAHTFAKTPTAIAQFLVDRVNAFLEKTDNLLDIIVEQSRQYFDIQNKRVRDNAYQLKSATNEYLGGYNEFLVRAREILRIQPKDILKQKRAALLANKERIEKAPLVFLGTAADQIASIGRVIAAYSPEKTLRRGFSITRSKDGQVIRSVEDVQVQDHIKIQLVDGEIDSQVE